LTSAVLFDLGDTLFRLLPIPDVTAEFAAALASEGFEDSEDEAARIIGNLSERLLGRHDLTEPAIAELAVPFIGSDARARKLAAMLDHMAGEADIARWEAAQGRDSVFEALRTRGLRVAYVSNTLTSPPQMRRRLKERRLLGLAPSAETEPGDLPGRPALARTGTGGLFVRRRPCSRRHPRPAGRWHERHPHARVPSGRLRGCRASRCALPPCGLASASRFTLVALPVPDDVVVAVAGQRIRR